MHKLLALFLALMSPTATASEVFIASGGITYHGEDLDPDLAEQMKHKLTDDGKLIFHPQSLSLNLITENALHLSATYLRDCYDKPAYMLGAGFHWHPFERFGIGYLSGIYKKKIVKFIGSDGEQYETAPPTSRFTYRSDEDLFVPMLLLTMSYKILKDDPYSVQIFAASNWYLNHAELGVGYAF